MTASALIASGILESYCLGFCSEEENALVEEMSLHHPDVREELNKIRESLSHFLLRNNIQPSRAAKTRLMHTIYSQQAELHESFVPLMHLPTDFQRYYRSAEANNINQTADHFKNLYVQNLPSTNEVNNFAVWIKHNYEEEVHTDCCEYIAILSGNCDMYMDGKKETYSKGEIITVNPGVLHSAIITSPEPMFALVQRQLF